LRHLPAQVVQCAVEIDPSCTTNLHRSQNDEGAEHFDNDAPLGNRHSLSPRFLTYHAIRVLEPVFRWFFYEPCPLSAARKRTSRNHRAKPDLDAKRVGERVRRLRQERDWNFDAFVEETELGRGYISELERGLVVPSLSALTKLAAALELPVADLVLGDTPRERLFELTRGLSARAVELLTSHAEKLKKPSA